MGRRLLVALVLLSACAAPSPQPQTVPETTVPSATVYVTATTLNVREDASADAPVMTQVRRGDQLTVLAVQNGWSNVKTPTSETGWVSSQHVSGTRPRARRSGCPPDSNFAFIKTPLASFSEDGPHGLVVVDATVNTTGDVTATKIVSNSTGVDALAKMAEREIRSAKFTPPYRDCVPRSFIFTYKRTF